MSLEAAIKSSSDRSCLERAQERLYELYSLSSRPDAAAAIREMIAELGVIPDEESGIAEGINDGDWGEDEIQILAGGESWEDAALALARLKGIEEAGPGKLPRDLKRELRRWNKLIGLRLIEIDDTDPSLDDVPEMLSEDERMLFRRLVDTCRAADEDEGVHLHGRDVTRVLLTNKPALAANVLRLAAKIHRLREETAHEVRGDKPEPFDQLSSDQISGLVNIIVENPCRIEDLSQSLWALASLGVHGEDAARLMHKMQLKLSRDHGHIDADLALSIWSMGRLSHRGETPKGGFGAHISSIVGKLQPHFPTMAARHRGSVVLGLGRAGSSKNMAVQLARGIYEDPCAGPRDWATAALGLSNFDDFGGDRELVQELARRAILDRGCPRPAQAIASRVLGELSERGRS